MDPLGDPLAAALVSERMRDFRGELDFASGGGADLDLVGDVLSLFILPLLLIASPFLERLSRRVRLSFLLTLALRLIGMLLSLLSRLGTFLEVANICGLARPG